MSKTIDEKVVEMRFDNKHFESNVQTTMSTLDKLKAKLNLEDMPIIFDKFADIDNERLDEILSITKSQVFATQVTNDKKLILK